ncbi:hypothetical protein [Lonepinella sp. BR2271]|uniref:hypothetical protein n=1 Tax=Lonepinella sp. BR2271 TaxID=3434550 RepID=UPI003F6E28B5
MALAAPDATDNGDWNDAVRGQFKFTHKRKDTYQLEAFFDPDVIDLIIQHNNTQDRQRTNNILRALFV